MSKHSATAVVLFGVAASALGAPLSSVTAAAEPERAPRLPALAVAPDPQKSASIAPASPVTSPGVGSSARGDGPVVELPGRTQHPQAEPKRPAAAGSTALPRHSVMAPTLVAHIDLTRQRLKVSVNGTPLHSWPISSGRTGYETPRGTFRGSWMSRMWYSRTYDNAPMPHAVFFNSGIAVHATTSTRLLGQPASHGCVRVSPANAETFYALVQKHGLRRTQFTVVGSTPAPVASRPRRAGKVLAHANAPARGARRHVEAAPVRAGRSSALLVTDGRGHVTLPPSSPYRGRQSFVHNGVVYVKVR